MLGTWGVRNLHVSALSQNLVGSILKFWIRNPEFTKHSMSIVLLSIRRGAIDILFQNPAWKPAEPASLKQQDILCPCSVLMCSKKDLKIPAHCMLALLPKARFQFIFLIS